MVIFNNIMLHALRWCVIILCNVMTLRMHVSYIVGSGLNCVYISILYGNRTNMSFITMIYKYYEMIRGRMILVS